MNASESPLGVRSGKAQNKRVFFQFAPPMGHRKLASMRPLGAVKALRAAALHDGAGASDSRRGFRSYERYCAATANARGGESGWRRSPSKQRGVIGEGEHRPGFLHFPKKPFVAKAARCDLSTVQVLVHICRVYFCLGPHRPSITLMTLKFATAGSSGLPLDGPDLFTAGKLGASFMSPAVAMGDLVSAHKFGGPSIRADNFVGRKIDKAERFTDLPS